VSIRTSNDRHELTLQLPPELIDAIAERAARLVLETLNDQRPLASPYLTIPEAAAYARCKRQRIDDLLSARRLTRYKDGRRTLILKAELDAWLGRNDPAGRAQPCGDWISADTELVSEPPLKRSLRT
jgi:excisionase family DNA binding protein